MQEFPSHWAKPPVDLSESEFVSFYDGGWCYGWKHRELSRGRRKGFCVIYTRLVTNVWRKKILNPTQVRPAERKPKRHTKDQITALLGRGRAKGAAKIRVKNDLGLEYCKRLKRWVSVDRDEI